LALPPASNQEQVLNENLAEIKTQLSKPLDAYQIPNNNHELSLLPLEIPDIHKLLVCINPLGQEEKPHFENANLGKNSLSLENQGTFENRIKSTKDLADIATFVEDIYLPPILNSFTNLNQSIVSTVIKAKDSEDIKGNQAQEKSSVIKGPTDQTRKKKNGSSELTDGTPVAKIQRQNSECLLEGEVVVCSAASSDRAPVNTTKHSHIKPPKAASSKASKAKDYGQKKTKKTRENNSKKAEDSKKTGNNVKSEEKATITKMKQKRNQPELSQETFKKP
jgi:hypothetical protein